MATDLTGLRDYEDIQPLAVGGMGFIYRARHRHLGEGRAIKTLRPVSRSKSLKRRLRKEARLASRLRHPRVVRVLDFLEVGDDAFLVMELLNGPTLAEWMRRDRESGLDQRLRIARQVLEGLHYLHAQGVVHGDITPENLMFSSVDEPLDLKIIDLGVARETDETHYAPSTTVGDVAAKARYAAPEQFDPHLALPPDHRADIFSAGVVIYELLSGRQAFPGSDIGSVISSRLNSKGPDLEIMASVSVEVASAVAGALNHDPSRRYQSVTAFNDALGLPTISSDEEQQVQRRRRALQMAVGLTLTFPAVLALALRTSRTVSAFRYVRSHKFEDSSGRALDRPFGLSFDEQGRLLISSETNQVLRADLSTGSAETLLLPTSTRQWETTGVLARNETVLVGDRSGSRIQVLGPAGRSEVTLDDTGQPVRDVFDLASGPDDSVYVVVQGNDVVRRIDPTTGTLLGQFGGASEPLGGLARPWGVAVAGDGTVYVTDNAGGRIAIFAPDGEHRGYIGEGRLVSPAGIALDRERRIVVASRAPAGIHVFSPNGELLGEYKPSEQHVAIGIAQDVAIGPSGSVFVADFQKNVVHELMPNQDHPVLGR